MFRILDGIFLLLELVSYWVGRLFGRRRDPGAKKDAPPPAT